ncbi:hypothetical protein Tco_0955758 [Tanacetum coccineum]|uniref:Uncharacterized protein n=1 Tax=Tanacetum coccineum TaxID=301880 RepID=A0ABQ5E832_9ASTR
MKHGSEKIKSPEKMKSPEKIKEKDVDAQKEMKEVKESGVKRKKSLPRKRSTVKRQKMEIDDEKEDLKVYLNIVLREDVESLSTKYRIMDWKTYTLTENFMYYQIFRGDGSSKNYKNGIAIHMLTENKYPLSQEMISKMLKKKLEADHESSQAFELLRIDQGVGSTSGIRACALRNFDLGVMELENSQNNALAKLPMLKLGEYEMWEIRIKQYFQI